jgi:hypothetical protein
MFRVWGGEGERGGKVDVNVNVDNPEGEEQELSPEQKAAKEAQDKIDKAEQKAKDAEKRAADAETKLTEKEREGMEEAERTAAERDDYKEKYEKLLKIVETSTLDTAIMKMSQARNKDGSPKYDWHDPEAVRTFIDKEAVKLNIDTGEVEGLDKQLSDIAKTKPYLLVAKEDRDGGGGPPPPRNDPATGAHPFGGQTHQRETDSQKLAKKYKFDHLVIGGASR